MNNLPENKKIILFDGICNLCDNTVQFIIKHDKEDIFRFVALQSDLGKEIINHIGLDISKTDSIVLYEPGHAYYYKSQAAFEISKELSGIYQFLRVFSILPKWLTDKVYDYIARNRYKWYGKKDECMLPTPQLKAKFL
ncbi:thiol-disulfide oxidoreductase DCC family protein [Flavobacterium suzhouense]|uniref:Thiol-disulfide oxidoreductase DCC family protein n=1 Tax=Flavobacterium suzhouense TaxID=1529638 RepID=A0ABW5NW64_9FLAO